MGERMMVCYLLHAQTALQIPATHPFLEPLIRNLAKHPRLFSAALDDHEQGPPLCEEWEQSPGLRGRSGPSPRPFLRRTPTGILRNCNAGFKSPIQSPRSCQSDGVNKETLQHEVDELTQKDLALDQEIAQLLAEGYSLEELEKHISLLHEYNDIKDSGQMLLGKLAMIRGVTTKELYPKFDLELTD